ncbi:hypothetical protein AC070_00105 [Fannyhessea vaginae]|nr:hypothetical protein AC070_00105 [Fannyhessea vaginae]
MHPRLGVKFKLELEFTLKMVNWHFCAEKAHRKNCFTYTKYFVVLCGLVTRISRYDRRSWGEDSIAPALQLCLEAVLKI